MASCVPGRSVDTTGEEVRGSLAREQSGMERLGRRADEGVLLPCAVIETKASSCSDSATECGRTGGYEIGEGGHRGADQSARDVRVFFLVLRPGEKDVRDAGLAFYFSAARFR